MLNLRPLLILVPITLLTGSGPADQTQPTRLDASSEPVTRQISGTEKHEYRVTLKPQQALHIVVNSRGVNIVMNVSGPDGEPIVETGSHARPSPTESVWVIASKAGDYTLGVLCNARLRGGRYELRVDALRDATADDRKHVALQDALLAALRSDTLRAARESFRQVLTAARALKDDAVATTASNVLLLQLDPSFVLETSGLNSIPGAPRAYYSSGYEQRARSMRDRLKPAIDFFESKLQVNVTVHLALLARDDWSRLTAMPYSTPFSALALRDPTTSSPRIGLVCIGTTHEASMEQMWAEMKRPGALSPDVAAALKATGVSFDDGAQLGSDERMYHELGHVYAQAYGIVVPGRGRWLNEFLATFLWVAYEAEVPRPRDPGRMFMAALTDYHLATYRPKGVTLGQIGANGPGDRGWYELQFRKRAEDVYKTQGVAFFQRVRNVFPPTNEPISLEESLTRLEKISPGWIKWAADLAALGPSEGAR
jgi:hypothetical protein